MCEVDKGRGGHGDWWPIYLYVPYMYSNHLEVGLMAPLAEINQLHTRRPIQSIHDRPTRFLRGLHIERNIFLFLCKFRLDSEEV